MSVPNSFICPITGSIMSDPVIAPDTHTYERLAITEWLRRNPTSPITRQPMTNNTLVENRALASMIEEYLQNGSLMLTVDQMTETETSTSTVTETKSNSTQTHPVLKTDTYIIRSSYDKKLYKLSKTYPESETADQRIPTTYICLIDVSGSMGSVCNISSAESDGFSRLDLTKHSLNTIIQMLSESDELILIKFTTNATMIFSNMMNSYMKSEAKRIVNSLEPENSTNIWDAINMGYSYAKRAKNSNIKMILLTDGESNMNPPKGILPTLSAYLANPSNNSVANIELTTFGFSSDIDSKLLYDISQMTKSGFNFIPDASMVGTTFINNLANSLATTYVDYVVQPIDQTDQVNQTNLTAQTDIIEFADLNPELKYEIIRYHTYDELKKICLMTNHQNRNHNDQMVEAYKIFKEYLKLNLNLNQNPTQTNTLLNKLFEDFESDDPNKAQIDKALSRDDWFRQWGYHYLLSLSSAHFIRRCHNFKDSGVQSYGSSIFDKLRDEANDIFCQIPAPVPSAITNYNYSSSRGGYSQSGGARSVPSNMSAYVNSSGPCFAPQCRILLKDRTLKPLSEIDGSEELYYDETKSSKIKYILRTKISETDNMINVCESNKLIITPWHPVYDPQQNKWVFPHTLMSTIKTKLDYVYNIVLESGHYFWIEGFKCVSMGHDITVYDDTNKILEHPYYGSSKVVQDIEQFAKSSDPNPKIITMNNWSLIRDENDLVCKIVQTESTDQIHLMNLI